MTLIAIELNTGDDPNATIPNVIKDVFGPSALKILTVKEHDVGLYVLTCNAVLLKVKWPGTIIYTI